MEVIKTEIPDVVIIQPKIFGDHRGYFFESFNLKTFNEKVIKTDFVQDNESKSSRGVLRGLHFQKPPYAQAKLVRCIKGCVLDVAVDIRVGSPTYGKYVAIELSEENKQQLFVPRGFAHGYSVLSEEAIFAYKVDNWYAPEYDSGIRWDDTDLGIDWKLEMEEVKLSEKDSNLLGLKDLESPFKY
ncbi:dTDP-4-dehydrorhamnose 3,5-epimerase [Tenacibaculum xiamenense]|uniref:dTDP-4-dehydrorhamnose 3,5-epimerase n=1 Tax=Tenacibaculum xiamenense TaxID=1261553 RepID=UPI003892F9CE